MSNETMKYVPSIALRNYSIIFFLLAVVFVVSKNSGVSTEVLLLRLAIVPLAFLAPLGLASLYRKPIYEHRVTTRGVEYAILSALIASLTVSIVLWSPDKIFVALLQNFFMVFVPFLFVMLLFMAVDIKKNKTKFKNQA